MDNNDILIRLRYAIDIKDIEMVEIFKLGGLEVTVEEVRKMLIKSKSSYHNEVVNHGEIEERVENIKCKNSTLDSFLNGFIMFKRGNLNRSLAIYLIKRFTPHSLSEIGKIFKMDYSAVSQAAKRFEKKCEVNQEIKEVMQKVITALKEE